MLIGKVIGTVVSTLRDEKVVSLKFQIVQELDENAESRGRTLVAADAIGAGHGDIVLYASGSSARQTTLTDGRPIDAAIFAIVDSWDVEGEVRYRKEGLEAMGIKPAEV